MSPYKPKAPCPRCKHVQCTCGYTQYKVRLAKQRRPYSSAERTEHKHIIKAWVAEHGWFCPGDAEHAAHAVREGALAVDHLVPVSLGGALVGGAKGVHCLCAAHRQGGRLSGGSVRS